MSLSLAEETSQLTTRLQSQDENVILEEPPVQSDTRVVTKQTINLGDPTSERSLHDAQVGLLAHI